MLFLEFLDHIHLLNQDIQLLSLSYLFQVSLKIDFLKDDLLKKVDSLIIESNHDVEMLLNSERPWYLKNRILSIKGHMSNKICGEVLNKILDGGKVNQVILAHLSEECNTEELAIDTVLANIDTLNIPEIYVAKQWVALAMLEV